MSIASRALEIGAGVASGSPIVQLQASSPSVVGCLNIGVELLDATETDIGLVKSLTTGTATTSSSVSGSENTAGASGNSVTTNLNTAWSVAPTIAASPVWFRRVKLPSKGASVEWSWPEEFPLILGTSVLLWNIGAGAAGALAVYFRVVNGPRIYLPQASLIKMDADESTT